MKDFYKCIQYIKIYIHFKCINMQNIKINICIIFIEVNKNIDYISLLAHFNILTNKGVRYYTALYCGNRSIK